LNVVLIETSGNQNFIFATNKLRENIGASELTYRAGMLFVRDAVQAAGGPDAGITEVVAASGKAILLVPDAAVGRKIVSVVTRRALEEAPGLDLRGVVGPEFTWDQNQLHQRVGQAHRQLEALQSRLPGPVVRFQRLPVVDECVTSGLPAKRVADERDGLPPDEHGPRSAVSLAKLGAGPSWRQRLSALLRGHQVADNLPDATTELENLGCDWLAVVHADGNDLGQVFLNFGRYTSGDEDYVNQLRQFSEALDHCTEKAFCTALGGLHPRQPDTPLPVVPLVLGGDDLTVVCDGRQAMTFAFPVPCRLRAGGGPAAFGQGEVEAPPGRRFPHPLRRQRPRPATHPPAANRGRRGHVPGRPALRSDGRDGRCRAALDGSRRGDSGHSRQGGRPAALAQQHAARAARGAVPGARGGRQAAPAGAGAS
jgi:hypothetical protein